MRHGRARSRAGRPADRGAGGPTILHTIVLVREDRSTGDTDVFLGDTAGGPLTPVTDTPLVREDMCGISHDGAVTAFRRGDELIARDGASELLLATGVVSNPMVSTAQIYWALDHASFVGVNIQNDVPLSLLVPPGAQQVDELSTQSARISCSAVVPPSTRSTIWIYENTTDPVWWPLQAAPAATEQFQSSLLGDWIVYSFRDGSSPFAGLRIANVVDGTIRKTIRSAEADLTNAGWFHGQFHDEVEMEPLSPESVGYDLIYVKTRPGSPPSIVTRDLETDTESALYSGDERYAYLDVKVALQTGYP